MIIQTKKVSWFKAAAITAWPFIFIDPAYARDQRMLAHEMVHMNQQRTWAIWGLGVGLLVWHFLYLFCLPVGWNYFRHKWESEAMSVADGWGDRTIKAVLREAPYYLWWM